MAVRIQLASNFQVIELTYDDWDEVTDEELEKATNMVNNLGQIVKNDIKTKETKKEEKKEKEELATEGQIKFLVGLGMTEKEAKKMTKKEAWQYIKDNK